MKLKGHFGYICCSAKLSQHMKKFTSVLIAILGVSALSAQTLVFHENFETPDSVTASGNPAWAVNTVYQSQGLQSYRNQVAVNDSSFLITDAFSTVGNSFVILDFDHICKIDYFDIARIHVSNDNGNTWQLVTQTHYLGTSNFGALGNYFNSAAYSVWQPANNALAPSNTWWQAESFDISTLCANVPQAKIKFTLKDGNSNGANGNYGWLIDHLRVTAAASELYPPHIAPSPPLWSGYVYNLGPFTVNDTITDVSGIDTATLYYSVNNGPYTGVGMSNTSGNIWSGVIPAVTDSDTVCFYVQAFDASPAANMAQWPSSGCQQFIAFSGITFPFFDDFESSNLWTDTAQNPSTVWDLGMPAFGATNSTHSGNNAWDVNLTTAYQSSAACVLQSPVFDFSSTTNATMSFWHNYNTENGWDGMRVDYTTDGNTWQVLGVQNDPNGVNWYNSTLSATGQPGWAGNSGGWVKSEYDLSLLNNVVGPVQFRFWFNSDFSINYDGYSFDDFAILPPFANDAEAISVVAPDASSCLPAGNIPLSVSFSNEGANTMNGPFDIVYVLDNGTPVVEQYVGNVLPGVTDTFTFVTLLNNTAGTHTLTWYIDYPGDGWNQNDTNTIVYNTSAGVTVPYINDFESGPISANDFCLSNTAQGQVLYSTAAGNNGSAGLAFDAVSSLGWDFGADTITTSPFYVWSPSISETQRANARLIVNTTGYNELVLEFDSELRWAFDDQYTNFRVKVNGQMITPHMRPNFQTTPYQQYRYMLNSFLPAPYLIIDFESSVAYDLPNTGTGVLLDNVHIYRPDSLDASCIAITQPGSMSMSAQATTVSCILKNYGTDTLTSIPVNYSVNAGPATTGTWIGTLLPNATTTYTFATTYVSPTGAHDLCVWTSLSGDTALWNDTTCTTVIGMQLMPVPYYDDFEGPQTFAAVTTYATSWELGTPAAPLITGAASGVNAWEVNLNGPYQNNSNEYLYSPFFDFSQATNVELRFNNWYNCDNYSDGGRVEYSTDGGITWIVLGTQFDPNGVIWYNQAVLGSSGLPGWSGTGGSYFQSKYNLTMFNNYPTPIQFRFVFTSDQYSFSAVDGWAIDNFELYMDVNAATNTIQFGNTSPLPLPGNNFVKVNIQNNGTMPLTQVNATLNIDNNNIVTDNVTLSPPLQPGQAIQHQFSQQWTGASPGYHNVKCWVTAPNGLTDTNPLDDTTLWRVSVMDTFATYPYCNNFESTNGIPPLTTMNAVGFTNTQNSWEQGTPQKNIIQGAHGGTGAWMTDLTVNYLQNDSSGLFLPVFTVDTVNCYHIEFYTYYLTPAGTDGGVIEYSHDYGATWTRLGSLSDPNWYDQAACTGLGSGSQPNMGGTAPGWILKERDIRFHTAGPVIMRFRFGSNASLQSEGWAIDDVCFSQIPPCNVGMDEQAGNGLILEDAYPNPTGTTATIGYTLPESGNVNLVLLDVLGNEVQSQQVDQPQGYNTWTIDVSNLADGVYFYELQFGDQRVVKRLVVNK
jgi:Secretion system C-terminal sorting domain/CARDB